MQIIKFDKNKDLFDENLSTGIKFSSDIDPEIVAGLNNDQPINELSLPILLSNGEVRAEGPSDEIKFKDIPELTISSDASFGAGFRLGIFDSAEEVMEDLQMQDKLNIKLPATDDTKVYGLFSYGYTISGDVEGEWPIGKVSLTTDVDGSHAKRGVVILLLNNTTGLRSAVDNIIGEIKSPKRVTRSEDLAQGTYLIMEREGALSAAFGAKAGFDFDWSYESQNENFPGTVGLQAKLGAQINIGFQLAGEFVLMLSRPDANPEIDLKLYKRKQNGWNFASGVSASAKADIDDFADLSVEDLIKSTIGIHHGQIIEDLKRIRSLASPEGLEKKLHGLTDGLLQKITSTDQFQKAKEVMVDLLDKWDAVGNEGGSKILDLIEENSSIDLAKVKDEFKDLSKSDLSTYLQDKLSQPGFSQSPLGQVLEVIVPFSDLLEIVLDDDLTIKLKEKAGKISEFLDLEAHIKNLHATISKELSLDNIKRATTAGDLGMLGGWLKEKLSSLTQNDLFDELKAINQFIIRMEENAPLILEKVKNALQKTYGVSLSYAYQKEKEHSALIDCRFDFGANPDLSSILDQVLDGEYDQLLTDTTISGIHLNKGLLTHRIKKQQTLSLSIPGVKRDFTRINQSIANGTFIDEKDGRLIMYDLEADDIIRRSKRLIQTALTGNVFGKKKQSAFGIEKESMKLAFSFKMQKEKMKTKQLEKIIEPFILANLPDTLPNVASGGIERWIDKLDKKVEVKLANGPRNFGPTLINMELRAPSSIGSAWYNAPGNVKHEIYNKVSASLQAKLREFTKIFSYDNEELVTKNYKLDQLHATLLYISLPAIAQRPYSVKMLLKNTELIFSNLVQNISELSIRLHQDPDAQVRKVAEDFARPGEVANMILIRYQNDQEFRPKIGSIISTERNKIKNLIKVAATMEKIRSNAGSKPEETINRLAEFGADLSKRLNNMPVGFLDKLDTRFIGINTFLTVALVLDDSLAANTTGWLELMVLKESSNFEMKTYLEGKLPDPEDLIVSQKLMDLR